MKNEDLPTTTTTTSTPLTKKDNHHQQDNHGGLFGKGRYKFWALAAILLLAFWSMLTGTVTLKWSAGNLNRISDDIDSPIHDDLDVLEIEEREKVVKHMWDVYTHSRRIKLPRFWQEAFEAAYEELASDVQGVRDTAVSEIAKMSMRSLDLEPLLIQSTDFYLNKKALVSNVVAGGKWMIATDLSHSISEIVAELPMVSEDCTAKDRVVWNLNGEWKFSVAFTCEAIRRKKPKAGHFKNSATMAMVYNLSTERKRRYFKDEGRIEVHIIKQVSKTPGDVYHYSMANPEMEEQCSASMQVQLQSAQDSSKSWRNVEDGRKEMGIAGK
ncbi:hypothetical protein GIB67_017495 [Kingdonia uniflora]|uniref:Uncharacterized protein n=1 Tax=Kingdonia uniflora TaxID=39325 RepID=A0A7J7M4I8_9MAGN|nr:hypothetical protein GIB67_017495 [Kingdonia uniflora]